MKTVFKTLTDSRKANQKRRDFEARTGLKWDCYHTGAGMTFTPIATMETPTNEDAAAALLPHLTQRGVGFIKLAETSGVELVTVVSGAWTLVKAGKAVPIVNRLGHFAGIYIH